MKKFFLVSALVALGWSVAYAADDDEVCGSGICIEVERDSHWCVSAGQSASSAPVTCGNGADLLVPITLTRGPYVKGGYLSMNARDPDFKYPINWISGEKVRRLRRDRPQLITVRIRGIKISNRSGELFEEKTVPIEIVTTSDYGSIRTELTVDVSWKIQ